MRVNVFRSLATRDLLAWREYERLISVATGASDLELSVSAPGDVEPGGDLTYAVSVRNMGRATASDVEVEMSLTRGATFSSASGDDSVDCSGGPTVTCEFGEVDGAETETVEVTVNVPTDASGLIVNTALVSMDTEKTTDPNRRNNRARVATVVKTAPPSTDRAALVVLYDSTNGEDWADNTNWLSEAPLGEWYGVTTDEDGRVTTLNLYENQLSGPIPPEMGNLSKLSWLDLDSNQLSGSIPPEMGSLSSLWGLFLYDNQLSGPIPSSLSRLSNMEFLSLSSNQLSGSIPPWMGSLSKLINLALDSNRLSGTIPSSLGSLSNLRFLFLGDNQLSGTIPSTLGNLSKLINLHLGGNLFTGCIPDALKNVPNNDLDGLGLPFCNSETQTSIPNTMPQPPVATSTPVTPPPTADAGSDQYVQPGDLVTLDGRGSSSDATYNWWLGGMQIEGGDHRPIPCYIWDVVNLSNPSGRTTIFTAPELRNS